MEKQISYRRASQDDINVVTNLLCVLYEMTHDEVHEENEQLFADKNQAFFLALDGEKIIGVSHGSLRREYVNGTNDDLKGYLEAIYVMPEYRQKGIAARLVKTAERWMVMHGCREVASDCLIENSDSYNFHKKIGFEETERAIFFLKPLESLEYGICEIDSVLREKVQPILDGSWGSHLIATGGKLWDSRTMPGFVAVCDDEILGYLLCEYHNNECEIMVLESIAQNIGIASALIEQVKKTVKASGVSKVIVQTSNDNTHAFRFYQRRGFTIRNIRKGAMDAARKLKPSIPLTGNDGIHLRDEIEFEIDIL
jgi:GNAT superfamily N-acetyltransferase